MDRGEMYALVEREIEDALGIMLPSGEGRTTSQRVRHWLNHIAQLAFKTGQVCALRGLMTADDVAEHFQISPRRARALISNRHERFGVGMRFGKSWLIHRRELPDVEPDEKYRERK